MGKLINLTEVNATIIPGQVLVLLSKYSQVLQQHTGLVIKVSSMNVFKHVDNTRKFTDNVNVHKAYKNLLLEVNKHLASGSMQTHAQRQLIDAKKQKPSHIKPLKKEATLSNHNDFLLSRVLN